MAPRRVYEEQHIHVPVQEAVEAFLHSPEVQGLSQKTIQDYGRLQWFAEWGATRELMLDQVDAKVVSAYVEYFKKTHKPQRIGQKELSSYTLAGLVRVIQTWLNWCLDSQEYGEHVTYDTIRRIKKPKIVKVIIETFSTEQIAALRKACAKEESPHLRLRAEVVLWLLLDTGIRASELCTLKIMHVDLSPRDPHITVFGKGQRWGEVGMGSECRTAMARYLRQFRLPTLEQQVKEELVQHMKAGMSPRELVRQEKQLREGACFFMNRYGEPLQYSGLEKLIGRLGEWADIKGVRCSPHTFRHTFSSLFMRNGGDIYTLSKLLRHSSVKVTEEYLKSIRQWEARHHARSVVDNL